MKNRCIVCGSYDAEKHHFKTRGSGGSDGDWNLMYLCRREHSEIHQIGATTFAAKYDKVANWLLSNGWIYNDLLKRWRHDSN